MTLKKVATGMDEKELLDKLEAAHSRIAELEAKLASTEGVHEELSILHLKLVKQEREQKKAKKRLEESEGRFRALFENRHAVMFIIDPGTGLIEDANPAAAEYYGYSVERLKSMSIMQLNTLPPKEINRRMEQAKQDRLNYFEFQHRLADGSVRDVEVVTGPVLINGKDRLFSIIHDITSKKGAEAKLLIYKLLITSTPDMISLVDRDYVYRLVNDSYVNTFNRSRELIMGKSIPELLGQEFFEQTSKPNLDRAFEGETLTSDTSLELPGRGTLYLSVTYHPVTTEEGTIDFVAIIAKDVTQVRQSQKALKEFSDRLDLATDAGMIGIWEYDVATQSLIWDDIMMQLYRTEASQFGGSYQDWRQRIHPDDLAGAEQRLRDGIAKGTRISDEFRIVWPDGQIRHMKADGIAQTSRDGQVIRVTGVNQDITETRELEEKLRHLATTDSLTGASNRRRFMSRGEEELSRSRRYRTPMTMLTLDIDLFKKINDTYGHPVGDEVLKSLVKVCMATLRTTDIFARMGGEEFSALLPETDLEDGVRTARRLRKAIEASRVSIEGGKVKYTVSVGVTQLLDGDETLNDLMQRADRALYAAKDAGRNRVETA